MHENFLKKANARLIEVVKEHSKPMSYDVRRDFEKSAIILSERAGIVKYFMDVKGLSVVDISAILDMHKTTIYSTVYDIDRFLEQGEKNMYYKNFYGMYKQLLDIDDKEENWNSIITGIKSRGRYNKEHPGVTLKVKIKPVVPFNKEELPSPPEEVVIDIPSSIETKSSEMKYDFERIMRKRMLARQMLKESWLEVRDNVDYLLNDIKEGMNKCYECLQNEYGELKVREFNDKKYSEDFVRKIEVIHKRFFTYNEYFVAINMKELHTTVTARNTGEEIFKIIEEFNRILNLLEL